MNYLFKLILSISLMLFFSCGKEKIENNSFDFHAFKIEIQKDQDYIDYINSGNLLFQQLANKEIAIFDIHNELTSNGIQDFCNVDMNLINRYDGAQKLVNGFCAIKTHLLNLSEKNKFKKELTVHQHKELFVFDYTVPSDHTQATSRVKDCLKEFNETVNWLHNQCTNNNSVNMDYMDCLNLGLGAAVISYDYCCNNGGSGCAPR